MIIYSILVKNLVMLYFLVMTWIFLVYIDLNNYDEDGHETVIHIRLLA